MRALHEYLQHADPACLHSLPQQEQGITRRGLLELMKLFLKKDRCETCWVMLRALE